MKQILLSLLVLFSLPIFSQEEPTVDNGQDYIVKEVPRDFKLKDKIIIANHSSYNITQLHIDFPGNSGSKKSLGSTSNIYSGRTKELASFEGNWLKNIRGHSIEISIKGKIGTTDEKGSSAFKVMLSEQDHDLYVEVFNNDKGVIFKRVPQELDLKDKVFIVNKSAFEITHAALALVENTGNYQPIASMDGLAPGDTYELISYSDNELANLRGRVIALKIRGKKGFKVTDDSDANAFYDFNASLSEESHDLYIEVTSTGHGGNMMDF